MSASSRSSSLYRSNRTNKYEKLLNLRKDFTLDGVAFSNMHQHIDTEIIRTLSSQRPAPKPNVPIVRDSEKPNRQPFSYDRLGVMFSYNNMYGFRRNIPKYQVEPPTMFATEPKPIANLAAQYDNDSLCDSSIEDLKSKSWIGYPYWQNDYREFYPIVSYCITIKVGEKSCEHFTEGLKIKLVSKSTGLPTIKIDKSLMAHSKIDTKKLPHARNLKMREQKIENLKLLQRGKADKFIVEDQDIRTLHAIIITRDDINKEKLFVDQLLIDITRPLENKSLKFPINTYLNCGKQDTISEKIKAKFNVKTQNTIVLYVNKLPKFEYKIKLWPRLITKKQKDTQVMIKLISNESDVDSKQYIHLDNSLSTKDQLYDEFVFYENFNMPIKCVDIRYAKGSKEELYINSVEVINPQENTFNSKAKHSIKIGHKVNIELSTTNA